VLLSGFGMVGISGVNLKNNQDELLSPDIYPDISAQSFFFGVIKKSICFPLLLCPRNQMNKVLLKP
jgi:hypothetical protein